MGRKMLTMAFYQSISFITTTKSTVCFSTISSRISIFNRLLNSRFSSSVHSQFPDELSGLIDHDFNLNSTGQETRPESSVSPNDFVFLYDSVMDYDSVKGSISQKNDFCKYSDEVVEISDRINENGTDFDVQIERFLRKFRGKLCESLVISVLSLVKNTELGVRFFLWAGRQIGYQHSPATYHALLDKLEFNKKCRIPQEFLRKISEEDREILGQLLNILIRKCCINGYWNEALEDLGRLKDFREKPTKVTYNALIQVLLKANRMDEAFLAHREMSDLGYNMDSFTLGCFLRSLCKLGRWREALDLIEKDEILADTVIYTKMINGLCEAGLFDEAMNFLNRMRASSFIPNNVTYKTMLVYLLRSKELGRCKRLLNMMISEGCNPSPTVFNSLLHAFCTSGDYSYAYKLLKKMKTCGIPPGYVSYNILIGGVCGKDNLPSIESLDLAEKVYEEMLDDGHVLNKINATHFARCLCGAGKFNKAFGVIRELMAKGFVPDTSTYTNVITFLCEAQKVEKVLLLCEEMKKNCILSDTFTYTIMIDTFCKLGLIQQARNWFDEMIKEGCAPNVVTFTCLIHGYLKARLVSHANEIFEKMISMNCTPNIFTYTALIDGHCKAGHLQKACQIYSRMRGNSNFSDVDKYFNDSSPQMQPNVFTYGALIDGLCKCHKVVEAQDLLDVMLKDGCEPNLVIYDSLIDGLCKVGKLSEAKNVFDRMSEQGYSPSVHTYSSLIDRLFKEKRLTSVLKILSKMLENSCPPNVVTYTEMIDGLCKVGKTDEAYKLLLLMEEKDCPPNVVTYTALIDGFGKAGKANMCLELLRRMNANGCAPNFVTYRVLINHCCNAGLLEEGRRILEEMKQTYWPKYISGYCKVIQGFNREFLISLGLLEEISKNDVPLLPAYCILIESFCKAGRLDVSLELSREILDSSIKCSLDMKNIYFSLIKALCLASKVENAFQLYGDMAKRGCIPEFNIFFYLVKGLLKVNKWEEALQLSHSMCHMDIKWYPKDNDCDGG